MLTAAFLCSALFASSGLSLQADAGSSGDTEKKLAGYYVCFEDGEGREELQLRRGILTIRDGSIAEISEYVENDPAAVYLDPACVIFPGLLDIHSHMDYNAMQLWDSGETDIPWDNRFEWRASLGYKEDIKEKAAYLREHWGDVLYPGDPEICLGDVLQYFAELQAVAGGTTLIEGVNGSDLAYGCADSHDKIRLVRTTSCAEDLGRDEKPEVTSMVQLYIPDAELTTEDPATYLPPIDTSSWNTVRAEDYITGEDYVEEVLRAIENKTGGGFLIHVGEGRAGNIQETKDAYSRLELETFMKDIESGVLSGRYTAEDVRDAHIAVIHFDTIDPKRKEDRNFLEKYGIGVIWSPVSNLLLYADTPDLYHYLDDPGFTVAIGSDWSPSGSKCVWNEVCVTDELIAELGEETENTRMELLKACTLNPAEILGEEAFGNIAEGCAADFFILRISADTDVSLQPALDTFFEENGEDVEAVVIRGDAVYGERNFLEAFTGDAEISSYGQYEEEGMSKDSKYFYIPELFGGRSLSGLYEAYQDILAEADLTMSRVRDEEDPLYDETIDMLVEEAGNS